MATEPQADPDLVPNPDPSLDGGVYEDLLERARELATAKRAEGLVPPNTAEALDRLFLEVAPPGAGAEGDGLDALVEMMARYTFDPVVPVESTRPGLGAVMRLVKRALKPITVWQLRYLTDQLNAYAAAQAEVLRAVLRHAERGEPDATGPRELT
jgi:hypothetical protein